MASTGIVNGSIANLIGGVSQQPWNVRMPSQGQKMVNCHATITEFLKRRPSFYHVAPVSVPDLDGNFIAVSIDKGTDERYIALFGKSGVYVYDLNGNRKNVNVTNSGSNYLNNVTNASEQLRFCNIKDYTFCVNTTKKVSQSTDTVPTRAKEGIVFIKQANYQTKYNVILNGDTYTYETPSSTYEEGTDPPVISANLILTNLANNIKAGKSYVNNTATMLVGSVYLNDVEFKGLGLYKKITNNYKSDTYINGDDAYTVYTYENTTVSDIEDSHDVYLDEARGRAIVWCTSGNESSSKTGWHLIGGVTKANFMVTKTMTINIQHIFSDTVSGTIPSGYDEAYVIVQGDNHSSYTTSSGETVVIPSNYNTRVSGATLYISSKDGTEFTLSTTDSRSNTNIDSWKYTCSNIEDLPLIAPKDYLLKITGDNGTDIDDYYVKFVPDSDVTMTKGIWKECGYPESHMGFNAATMPHALVRNSDGTFTFDKVDWSQREVGDSITNAMPSFVGKKISNILFYRNRLCFLSDDNIIMSETNEFFNFFLTTMLTSVDNDPIDVAASGIKDTKLYGYSLFTGGLVVFSTKGQFLVEHDTVLSNSTISLSPVTEYESTDVVTPVSSGKTIFFAVDRGKYVSIKEYIAFDSDNKNSNSATDITAAVPSYILGNISGLECSSNEDIVLVRSSTEKNKIYVYKYFWNGNEKAQSSWYEWITPDDCYASLFFNSEVYTIMDHNGYWYLAKCTFEPSHKDDDEDFEFCIDRKVNETLCTVGSYDPLTKTTPITIPYVDYRSVIITRSGGDIKAGIVLDEVSRSSNTITVKGKVSSKSKFFVGVPYESTYTFTTIAIRNTNNSAITTGRLQLRGMSISLNSTGQINFEVKPKGKNKSIYNFTGKKLGEDSSVIGDIPIYNGHVKFPILSINNTTEITAFSDSHLPFAMVNADWEGFYTNRGGSRL